MKLREKFLAFMRGRYGNDQFSVFILVVYTILMLIDIFIGSIVISAVLLLLMLYMFFRVFSRNITKRRAENAVFLKIWCAVKRPFANTAMRIKNIRSYRYRKCRKCRKMLRLPVKKGKHTAVCPCCGEKRRVRITF